MDTYTKILKTIKEELTKSHQHLFLNDAVHTQLNKFRKRTRKRKTELGQLINDKGEVMREVKGDKDSVRWAGYMEYAYEKNNWEPLHVEHNHPNPTWSPYPTCLSYDDMFGLFEYFHQGTDKLMLKSVTAEDSYNNSRMTLVLGDSWHKPMNEWDDEMRKKQSKALELSEKLEEFHLSSEKSFYEHRDDYFDEVWDNGDYSLKTAEDFEFYNKLRRDSAVKSMKDTEYYEQLNQIKKDFRELDCKLIWEDMEDSISEKEVPDSYVNLMNVK